jgi:alkylation response protein AidB-like acyl-CoA dehydrogenase
MFTSGCDRPEPWQLESLCAELRRQADRSAADGPWRSGGFAALARHGVLAGFVPEDCGGTAAGEPALIAMLGAVAECCLTTALALTQWASAVRIIAAGPSAVRAAHLPALARGDSLTTVGISQLTTSRQHAAAPALLATATDGGWRLDGVCPWVTGGDAVDTIVTGAATADGGRMFFIVPTDARGLVVEPPLEMLALSGSRTSAVHLRGVRAADAIPPGEGGPRTGGLATTALAVGATRAAIAIVRGEAAARPGLAPIVAGLDAETASLAERLAAAASFGIEPADRDRLRADANGLVVRAAQAALTATKGAGFVRGHPAARLARESLFFLVWSCPEAVSTAMLCEFAGR